MQKFQAEPLVAGQDNSDKESETYKTSLEMKINVLLLYVIHHSLCHHIFCLYPEIREGKAPRGDHNHASSHAQREDIVFSI